MYAHARVHSYTQIIAITCLCQWHHRAMQHAIVQVETQLVQSIRLRDAA